MANNKEPKCIRPVSHMVSLLCHPCPILPNNHVLYPFPEPGAGPCRWVTWVSVCKQRQVVHSGASLVELRSRRVDELTQFYTNPFTRLVIQATQGSRRFYHQANQFITLVDQKVGCQRFSFTHRRTSLSLAVACPSGREASRAPRLWFQLSVAVVHSSGLSLKPPPIVSS